MRIKPTLKEPMSSQSEKFEKNFKKTMIKSAPNVNLTETDKMLNEKEQSLKKKIFSLAKMESLVFSDPKLSTVYDGMAENGEEKYGYHYNETIMNMLFNDYVLNSPQYLQKYKMSIPKEKKRRDKSGINKLKKDGAKKMTQSGLNKLEPKDVDESTSAGSAGGAAGYTGYAGPAAWSTKGDLSGDMKKKDDTKAKPISTGFSLKESNYLTDSSGFEKYINVLNEESDANFVLNNSDAYGSVDNMNSQNQKIIKKDIQTGKLNSNHNIKGSIGLQESVHDTVEYVSNRSGEEPFELHGNKWQFVNARYPDNKIDIGVYRFGHDLVYDYTWWQNEMGINENNIKEDTQTMIGDNGNSMANKSQAIGDQANDMPTGMQDIGGLNESDIKLLEDINNELNAFSVHHKKLKVMSEDKKTPSMIQGDRLRGENPKNFKKDLQHSGTKDIINVEKELEWKDQQTDVPKDPQKLGMDIEKKAIKTADMTGDEALKNVGNSANDKGDEIPKRNLTSEEQEEVDLYRNGQHSLVYDNEPSDKFVERQKGDQGDLFKTGEKQKEFRAEAPLYNKEEQPVGDAKVDKVQYDKNQKPGWNERMGFGSNVSLKESMITGRYINHLNKRKLIEFKLAETKLVESVGESFDFELDFTGLGNSYYGKTVDNKVIVNESIADAIGGYKFHTDGKNVVAVKNPVQNLSEGEVKTKPVINEQHEKMKHLLGYEPKNFVNTRNVKNNRGF